MKKFYKKIQFKPHVPDEKKGETTCKTCDGVGWLLEDDEHHVVACRDCNGRGVVTVCKYCGAVLRGCCFCDGAMAQRAVEESKRELERFEKANKISINSEMAQNMDMYYSDRYNDNEGYFADINDLLDQIEYDDSEQPVEPVKYVWATKPVPVSIDAANIAEDATCDMFDFAMELYTREDLDELQEALDKFCDKINSHAMTYDVDYNTAIML